MSEVFEYRGIDGLVIAEVLKDDNEETGGYVTGPVEPLLPVAEIGKTTESSAEAHHYDNQPMIIVTGEGPDEITVTGAGLSSEMRAKITGRSYDETTGALVEGPRRIRYFAMGYRTKDTNGHYRLVWRYKGTFNIPDENHKTEDSGTEANGTELVYTGIYTNHIFTKGQLNEAGEWERGPGKGLVVDAYKDLADVSKFFDTVTTSDTLKPKTV